MWKTERKKKRRSWLSRRRVHRQAKDRLFRFLFEKDREALLQLYNSLNGTDYQDVSKLQVVTIESAVYIVMKNDLAFVLAGSLNLYEHQSTDNPNMPLRFLIYLAQEYQKLVEQAQESLYGRKRIMLPAPQCVVYRRNAKTFLRKSAKHSFVMGKRKCRKKKFCGFRILLRAAGMACRLMRN